MATSLNPPAQVAVPKSPLAVKPSTTSTTIRLQAAQVTVVPESTTTTEAEWAARLSVLSHAELVSLAARGCAASEGVAVLARSRLNAPPVSPLCSPPPMSASSSTAATHWPPHDVITADDLEVEETREATVYKAESWQRLGIRFFSADEARARGVRDGKPVVATVAEGPVRDALHRGDRIVSIDNVEMTTVFQATETLREATGDVRLVVLPPAGYMDLSASPLETMAPVSPVGADGKLIRFEGGAGRGAEVGVTEFRAGPSDVGSPKVLSPRSPLQLVLGTPRAVAEAVHDTVTAPYRAFKIYNDLRTGNFTALGVSVGG